MICPARATQPDGQARAGHRWWSWDRCRVRAGAGRRGSQRRRVRPHAPRISRPSPQSIGGEAMVVDLLDRADDRSILGRRSGTSTCSSTTRAPPRAPRSRRPPMQMWDRIMELDATSPFRVTRALVPAMIKAGWGRVINIASNAGVSGYGYTAAYCAAKHAMVGFTRALAIDLARTNVTINAICPGWVETALADEAVARIAEKTGRSLEEAKKTLEVMSPQRRMIKPDEVAHAVADAVRRWRAWHPRPDARDRRRSDTEMTTELVMLEGPVPRGYADGRDRSRHDAAYRRADRLEGRRLGGEGPDRPVRADARQPARGVEGGARPRRRHRLDDDLRHRHGRVSRGAQAARADLARAVGRTTFRRWRWSR